MFYFRVIRQFFRASLQQTLQYRGNFFVGTLNSLIELISGILALWILFSQVNNIRGWGFEGTLAILAVYQIISALRTLVIEPSFEALAGMQGAIWTGRLDFTLLQPFNPQLTISFSRWNLFSLFDLSLGLVLLGVAIFYQLAYISFLDIVIFLITIACSILLIYSIFLLFTSLAFWNPGFMFTWLFTSIFQLARYPVGVYPGWIKLMLTWVIPVGLITTLPVEVILRNWSWPQVTGSILFTSFVFLVASLVFRRGVRRYASASS